MGLLDDTSNIGAKPPPGRVRPVSGIERKTPLRVDGVSARRPKEHPPEHPRPPDDEKEPDYDELIAVLKDAVERFNEDLRKSGAAFRVRLVEGGGGAHLQIVHETAGTVMHQTELLLTADIDPGNIEKFIAECIREKGLVIDVEDDDVSEPAASVDAEPQLHFRDQMILLADAVARFNEELRKTNPDIHIRLWDRGEGLHLQIVRETDDAVLHQTQLLLDADVTADNIEKFIDEFIREKGIFIDLEK